MASRSGQKGGAEGDGDAEPRDTESPSPGRQFRGRLIRLLGDRLQETISEATDQRDRWGHGVHELLRQLRDEAAGVEDEVPGLREPAVACENAAREAVAASARAMDCMAQAQAELVDALEHIDDVAEDYPGPTPWAER